MLFTTHFVCPNVGAELGVAKVLVFWPNAGGAEVAGVPNGNPNPIAKTKMYKTVK
jgi:hypothetical protein